MEWNTGVSDETAQSFIELLNHCQLNKLFTTKPSHKKIDYVRNNKLSSDQSSIKNMLCFEPRQ